MYAQQYQINLKQDDSWHMHQLHFHEGVELILVLSEGGELFYDKEMYPLHANSLLVLGSNKLHRTAGAPGTVFDRYVLRILPSLLNNLSSPCTNFASMLQSCTPCVQLDSAQARELIAMLEKLRVPADQKVLGWDIQREITLLQILLQICGLVQNVPSQPGTSAPDYDRVLPILEYIQQNYTQPITLDDLAHHFLIGKHYLCHIFKKGTGFSVMEYVIQLRILEAQRQLRQGCTVQEAGERSGFQSYAHFIRTFSSCTGVSPKQYAKQFKSGERSVMQGKQKRRPCVGLANTY